ncbi:MAG: pyruvate dehydrogenase complex dihydrolipoamide acetyltransferase [Flavobacteriales bacterium]|nr:pyruvate dehydrogenase complex dihydrolipoamide acetyltransferase [Flavobacteriales bacterium]MCX7768660.1 pyruvate dehydrogenase complex dihydrolipoamide acetyltransferase [Flavobacteriales bacterium]MDW8410791.1 pyruvate dehydrogenase complex dihydrolipoamide acetyltransferase [Flavobacteriales bacterium]
MAEIVRMPKLSDTMTEGVVAKWHKNVGDRVKSGDLLAEIETDKATMEFESFQEGVLLYKGVEEGQAAPVDSILAILGTEGEDISAILEREKSPSAEAPKTQEVESGVLTETKVLLPDSSENRETAEVTPGRLKASPLARRIAKEKGIELHEIKGTGEGGRIVKRDVESYQPTVVPLGQKDVKVPFGEAFTDLPLSQMRKAIARRLSESKFSAPHFYLTVDVDMDNILAARDRINKTHDLRISINDIIIKATAAALEQHPKVNASWLGDKIRYHHRINIGVAVAVEDGLVVPVIPNANHRTLREISEIVRDFAVRAREKKLQPQEMEGNTFTISNLGMFGIEQFTAIINPPDVCILAVGAVRDEVVVKQGSVQPGKRMKVTLSCDHRAVDGATGAAFLRTLKDFLEEPLSMFL